MIDLLAYAKVFVPQITRMSLPACDCILDILDVRHEVTSQLLLIRYGKPSHITLLVQPVNPKTAQAVRARVPSCALPLCIKSTKA